MSAKTQPEATVNGTTSPDERTVYERMVAVLGELPAIGKDQRNEQQKFMYRGHDDVMNALNPLLAKHGVFVVPDVLERVTAERTTRSGSTMYEVNLHVRFTFYGARGDSLTASTWGEGTDSGDKATNKAMTMAFKNVLNQAFAISSAEFSDADGETPEPTTRGGQGRRDRERTFDPGVDLLPSAIRGEGYADQLAGAQAALAPDLDWTAMIAEAATATLGPREQWDDPTKAQFRVRWSNAVAKVLELADASDLYHPDLGLQAGEESDDLIAQGIAWAFNGHALSRPLPRVPDETGGEAPESTEAPEEVTEEAQS